MTAETIQAAITGVQGHLPVDVLDNETLAEGLRRVIVQWTRAEEEFLPGVRERTTALLQTLESELGR